MAGDVRLALAGDTMLGREVARAIARSGRPPVAPEVAAVAAEADLFVLNLECCVSDRGEPWRAPSKPFFFRAPPLAAELLAEIGVDGGMVGCADHPDTFAAGPDRPGIAYADLRTDPRGGWLEAAVAAARDDADAVLVSPHWGANMTVSPSPEIRRAALALGAAGASVVAGHSAHLFHGVQGNVLYDLGDFIDDYRVDRRLRNDLGLLFLVDVDARGARRLEAVPLQARTRADPPRGGRRRRLDPPPLHPRMRRAGNHRHRTRGPPDRARSTLSRSVHAILDLAELEDTLNPRRS